MKISSVWSKHVKEWHVQMLTVQLLNTLMDCERQHKHSCNHLYMYSKKNEPGYLTVYIHTRIMTWNS